MLYLCFIYALSTPYVRFLACVYEGLLKGLSHPRTVQRGIPGIKLKKDCKIFR
jgi:hypothetical protein